MIAWRKSSTELPVWMRIVRNAGSILLSSASGEILTTYAVALAALALGPAGFGTLAEAQAFMDPFDSLAGFGLGQVVITIAASRGSCDGALRSSVMGIRFGFTVAAIIAAFGISSLTGRTALAPIMALIAVGMLFTPLAQASTLPFQCDQAMHRLISVPFLASVVRIATAYLAYWALCSPAGFQASGTAAGITGALLAYGFSKRYYKTVLRFDYSLAKKLIAIAWPAATLEFIVMVYSRG